RAGGRVLQLATLVKGIEDPLGVIRDQDQRRVLRARFGVLRVAAEPVRLGGGARVRGDAAAGLEQEAPRVAGRAVLRASRRGELVRALEQRRGCLVVGRGPADPAIGERRDLRAAERATVAARARQPRQRRTDVAGGEQLSAALLAALGIVE